ncbi:MAG TPA: hypothetical protein PKK48_04560 [Phycisphaerae bacterium]|nr:hypothetical protein [Phycisphaerae bacterium]
MSFSLQFICGCDDSPKEMLVDGNMVLFFDGLQKDVKIIRQISEILPGGLTRIRTQFKNTDDDTKWIDIQVVWRDADGMELYKTSWQSFHLPGRSVEQYDITSLKPAASYEFRIRKPDTKGKK